MLVCGLEHFAWWGDGEGLLRSCYLVQSNPRRQNDPEPNSFLAPTRPNRPGQPLRRTTPIHAASTARSRLVSWPRPLGPTWKQQKKTFIVFQTGSKPARKESPAAAHYQMVYYQRIRKTTRQVENLY